MVPNRWLRLRCTAGFSPDAFRRFAAGCRVWRAYVKAVLEEPFHGCGEPAYTFFPPELSADRATASLPLGGPWTSGSRAAFEDGVAHLLHVFLPLDFVAQCEEGLSEPGFLDPAELHTSWRPALGVRKNPGDT